MPIKQLTRHRLNVSHRFPNKLYANFGDNFTKTYATNDWRVNVIKSDRQHFIVHSECQTMKTK